MLGPGKWWGALCPISSLCRKWLEPWSLKKAGAGRGWGWCPRTRGDCLGSHCSEARLERRCDGEPARRSRDSPGFRLGGRGQEMRSQHLPALCQPAPSLPLCWPTGHQLAHCPSEKADMEGGFHVGRGLLMHAHPAGTARGQPPGLGARREGGGRDLERGEVRPPSRASRASASASAQHGAPTAGRRRSPPGCWQWAVCGACEQEIKSSGRVFFLTNRGFVCLFSWWL